MMGGTVEWRVRMAVAYVKDGITHRVLGDAEVWEGTQQEIFDEADRRSRPLIAKGYRTMVEVVPARSGRPNG